MRRQTIYLPKYQWTIHVYYDTTVNDAGEVLSMLDSLGCSEESILRTYKQLLGMQYNNGFTYTNRSIRQSVVSLGRASSFPQFLNSFVHELHHLATHIAQAKDLPLDGEEVCYMAGTIAQRMYHILMYYISYCGV